MKIMAQYGRYFDALARHHGKVRAALAETGIDESDLADWRLSPHFEAAETAIRRLADVPAPTKRRWTSRIATAVTQALEAGETLAEAARQSRISVQTIHRHCQNHPRLLAAMRARRGEITPEDVPVAVEMLRSGSTAAQVAEHLGVTASALSRAGKADTELGRVYRETVARPRVQLTPEVQARLRDMWDQGVTQPRIAQELHVSRTTLRGWVAELQLPARH